MRNQKYNKTIALVGQPNTGKSCVINHLTGAHAVVSNYPGTTVEITEGEFIYDNKKARVIDTPGTYTLHSDTQEQRLTQKILLEENVDVIVNIVDATNLARNLYFTLQLIDLEKPMILALNFINKTEDLKIKIDLAKLSNILGIPVVPLNALDGTGIDELKEAIFAKASLGKPIHFCQTVERIIEDLMVKIDKIEKEKTKHPPRALAVHLLEHDIVDEELLKFYPELKNLVKKLQREIEVGQKGHCLICPAKSLCQPNHIRHFLDLTCQERYEKCHQITTKVETRAHRTNYNFLEKIEHLIDRPILGFPILNVLAYLVFLMILWGIRFIGSGIEFLLNPLIKLLALSSNNIFHQGFWHNIFSVAIPEAILIPLTIVLPAMLCVYLLMAILEDTGLLSRFAVNLNRMMGVFGLQGQAIIPFLLGFGCRVPGVLATRILSTARERFIASTLVSIVIPCAAMLGIVSGVVAKFDVNILILILVLLFSWILLGLCLNSLLKGTKEEIILEVPPLRMPLFKNVIYKTWFRMKDFFTRVLPLLLLAGIAIRVLLETNIFNSMSRLDYLTKPLLGLSGETFAGISVVVIQRYLAPLFLLNLNLGVREATIACAMILVTFPCLPNSVILWRELGFKKFLAIFALAGFLSLSVGIILNIVLP
jgi:ferrous iron transport protein B